MTDSAPRWKLLIFTCLLAHHLTGTRATYASPYPPPRNVPLRVSLPYFCRICAATAFELVVPLGDVVRLDVLGRRDEDAPTVLMEAILVVRLHPLGAVHVVPVLLHGDVPAPLARTRLRIAAGRRPVRLRQGLRVRPRPLEHDLLPDRPRVSPWPQPASPRSPTRPLHQPLHPLRGEAPPQPAWQARRHAQRRRRVQRLQPSGRCRPTATPP
jgi:hypothetical protein